MKRDVAWFVFCVALLLLIVTVSLPVVALLRLIEVFQRVVWSLRQSERPDAVLGDLTEGFALRVSRSRLAVARAWYVWQVLCSVDVLCLLLREWFVAANSARLVATSELRRRRSLEGRLLIREMRALIAQGFAKHKSFLMTELRSRTEMPADEIRGRVFAMAFVFCLGCQPVLEVLCLPYSLYVLLAPISATEFLIARLEHARSFDVIKWMQARRSRIA
jgi:hypothetical protein